MNMISRLAAVSLAAALAAGCEGTSPTTPSSLFTTETFSGTVGKGALTFHSFQTGVTAPVIIRLTSFNPSNLTMGLALGTPANASGLNVCSITIGQAPVVQGSEFQVELPASTYCVAIFDAGQVPEATTVAYSLTIQHK